MSRMLLHYLLFSAFTLQATSETAQELPAPLEVNIVDYDGTIVSEEVPFQKELDFFKSSKGSLFGYFARSKTASKLVGWAQSSQNPFAIDWKTFAEKHNIKMDDFIIPEGGYKTFNDFFARQLKPGTRDIDHDPKVLTSPVDAKCTFVEDVSKKDIFIIKNSKWSLARMLGDPTLAELYDGGTLINFRLAPEDYHRFHFPCDATPGLSRTIHGKYHSVNPYVFKLGDDPLGDNTRNIIVLKSLEFDDPLCIIVGAMGVGKIIETYTPGTQYKKGDEMGYFKFGASTVCLLFRKGVIKPADDKLITNSQNMIETAVKQGQRIAIKANQYEERTFLDRFITDMTKRLHSIESFFANLPLLF